MQDKIDLFIFESLFSGIKSSEMRLFSDAHSQRESKVLKVAQISHDSSFINVPFIVTTQFNKFLINTPAKISVGDIISQKSDQFAFLWPWRSLSGTRRALRPA